MSTNRDTPPGPKKRESRSRAGTRKVTSLSAEQLERKRANDREAQRTIRQRTKEHIEHLEHQVAELKARSDQYDDIVRRNTSLESEVGQLRHQLSLLTGGQGFSNQVAAPYSAPSEPTVPSQFPNNNLGVPPAPRAPSVLSSSSQVSLAHEWQPYGSARSPSACESSDADYASKVEPYIFESQLHVPRISQAPTSTPITQQSMGINAPGSGHSNPALPAFPPYYQPNHPQGSQEGFQHPEPIMTSVPSERPMPVPSTVPSITPERDPRYPVFQNPPQYQHPIDQQNRNNQFHYPWPRHP